MNWAAGYVGIPFANSGAGRRGCHCWGLVRLVYRERLQVDLPAYDTITAEQLLAIARGFPNELNNDPWRPADGPRQDYDVILMHARSLPLHIGVAVGSDRLLHVERGIASMCVPIDHPRYRHRVIGAYRHACMR